eukprot:gnl/TRDRNA2_/TRDRNA2_126846_c0_seq3.p1 gnl/TRDRNA2_/TRDRNA2_126846_c0~~gnl/TRDRNA2_/TRDRNA2_126846_c0_seq3.p1  ORF type:complete len:189 (-),score=21.99 gnl/TRDRNA2_/TRDRNA2_126846_c0_seq3:551-1060(-)
MANPSMLRRAVTRISWKAMCISILPATMAVVLKALQNYSNVDLSLVYFDIHSAAYQGFSSLLGFLLVFRIAQSYNRYWDGCQLTHQMMGDWFAAASSLVAYTNGVGADQVKVQPFKHLIVRLISLLFAVSMSELEDTPEDDPHRAFHFQLLDVSSLDDTTLELLRESEW